MKKKILICITVLIILSLIGLLVYGIFHYVGQPAKKANLIQIPDISNVDVDTAKTILASKELIPNVKYEYHNCDFGTVIRTEPSAGTEVEADTIVTIYVCKGYKYYELNSAVGYMKDVTGIKSFSWDDDTKGFYAPYVKEGYLYIEMYLACTSTYELAFYGDFGTASINDTFDKTVLIDVLYDSKKVDNNGKKTTFTVKIPLEDLNVQKPTNIYIRFDFTVNGTRKTFEAGFDLHW